MSRSRRQAFAVIGGITLSVIAACWFLSTDRLSREARENFEWFSTLGFPDVKGCRYVRVATGRLHGGDGVLEPIYVSGFLLASDSNSFALVTPRLEVRTFKKTPAGTPEMERVGFEEQEFRAKVRSCLAELGNRTGTSIDDFELDGRDRGCVFVLAWCCWRQGMDSEARRLYERARNMPNYWVGYEPARKLPLVRAVKEWVKEHYEAMAEIFSRSRPHQHVPTLREELETDYMDTMMHRAVLGFADPSRSRKLLLQDFETFAKRFPSSKDRTNAIDIAACLKAMMADDATHKHFESNELAALPPNERARELIFELRDQTSIFCDRDVTESQAKAPSQQLEEMGCDAVPRLIDALDSKAFTRMVDCQPDCFAFHYEYSAGRIPTVGSVVQEILQNISGRNFNVPTPATIGIASNEASCFRINAERWWAECQKVGFRQILINGVSDGRQDACNQAELLAAKFPEALAPAVVAGFRATSDTGIRTRLLWALHQSKDPAAMSLLRSELQNSPDFQCRMAAASALRENGAGVEAVSAIIKEWERQPIDSQAAAGATDSIAWFLSTSGSPDAIAALVKGLHQRDFYIRYQVINAIGEATIAEFSKENTNSPSDAEWIAIEHALVESLDDIEEAFDFTREGFTLLDARVADVAGYYLSKHWPERYHFDFSASFRARERQRIECVNAWRRAHGQSGIPAPDYSVARVSPADACKITHIEWASNSAKPSSSLAARVGKLLGNRLGSENLTGLLLDFSRNPDPAISAFDVSVEKDTDLSGVRLVARLTPATAANGENSSSVLADATIGRPNRSDRRSRDTASSVRDSSDWGEIQEIVSHAVAAPPETQFKIRIRLSFDLETAVR